MPFIGTAQISQLVYNGLFAGVCSEDDQIPFPEAAKATIARASKPLKADLIDHHISRFRSGVARELQYEISTDFPNQ